MKRKRWCRRTLLGGLFWVIACGALCVSAPPAEAQDDLAKKNAAVRDFNVAAELQNAGLYDRAAEKWADFIKTYPDDERLDRANYFLGICQLHAKKFAEAAASFQTIISKYPNFENADGAQYNLGMAYFQTATASNKPEDFQKAADALGAVATKHANSEYVDRALYFQGEALYAAGKKPEACAAYEKLVNGRAASPLLADAYYALGTTQQELEQFDQAAATFGKFLGNADFAKHELAGEIRLRLGMALFAQEKHQEAEPHFAATAGLADFPPADFALLRQAQCKLELEQVDEAGQLFSQLLTKFPDSGYKSAAQLSAGKCCYLTEKLDDAVKMLQPLASANTAESPEAAYWLGRTLLKQDKPAEAFTVLDAAVKTHTSGDFAPYLKVAHIDAMYEQPEKRDQTAALYAQFVQQHPDHALAPQARYMAALSALGQEQFADARTHAEAFLGNTAYKDNELVPAVLYIAAESYLLAAEPEGGNPGGVAKAETLYRQLVADHPDHARVPRAQLRIGWCLYQKKQYDPAITHLSGVMAQLTDPAHQAEANLLIGRSYAATDRHAEAVKAYDAALKAKPDWPRTDELLIASAQSLRAADNAEEATKRLSRLIAEFAESTYRAQALYQLGEIAQEQKKYDEAVSHYKQVVEGFGESEFAAPARYGLAAAYYAQEKNDEAITQLNALLSGNADAEITARAHLLRGLVYQRRKEHEPAAKDLQAFLDTNPEGDEAVDARFALVLCLIGQGRFDPARSAMDALLAAKPDYKHGDKMYYELGHALLAKEDGEGAAAAFGSLAEKFPDSELAAEASFHVGRHHERASDDLEDETQKKAEVAKAAAAYAKGLEKAEPGPLREKLQYKLGDMQFRQEQYAEAGQTLLAQISDQPQGELVGPARFLAAEALFRQDKFQEALPLFAQVAADKVAKYHDQALYRAGVCATKMDNWAEAQKHFEGLLQAFPDFDQAAEARYGLARALQQQNKLDEARKLYEQVIDETETETAARAQFMIGEIEFGQGKFEDAIVSYLGVVGGYPYKEWQSYARFQTGRCYQQLGNNEKAVEAFQKVVDDYPDSPHAADAAKLVQDLK